jgi:hypothetical protein
MLHIPSDSCFDALWSDLGRDARRDGAGVAELAYFSIATREGRTTQPTNSCERFESDRKIELME